MKLNKDIVAAVEIFVRKLHEDNNTEFFSYHDIDHTLEVVYFSKLIAKKETLSEEDLIILDIASWFHDTGYFTSYDQHEANSVNLMRSFLNTYNIDEDIIKSIGSCICSTKIPQKASNKIEEIICDADMYHLAMPNFYQKSELLRIEQNHFKNTSKTEVEFANESYGFIKNHSYLTEYGRRELEPVKEINLENLKKKLKKNKKKKIENPSINLDDNRENGATPVSIRTIETMFRSTSRNQIHLSSIADNKANILISVNSIIISIIVTMLITRFNDYPNIIIPSLVLLLTNLITVIYAILATRPNLPSGKFNLDKVKEGKVNLLFFGNYYKMEYQEYIDATKEMLKDNYGLYNNMIMDQFFHGKVLGKKYNLVRTAYTIFMYGIIISVLAFTIAIILNPL